MEQMRRGKAETQTSDARFDEQFKLGHQMQSKVRHPYACYCLADLLFDDMLCEDHLCRTDGFM